jgi:hypothetical protein
MQSPKGFPGIHRQSWGCALKTVIQISSSLQQPGFITQAGSQYHDRNPRDASVGIDFMIKARSAKNQAWI